MQLKFKMRCLFALSLFSVHFAGNCQSLWYPVDFHDCRFTAVAHRGYSEFYPENTLIAIEEAFRRGVKYCEVDVAVSSDGVYVLHHDPYTIVRTTSGKGKISDLSWTELSKLDAGSWKESHFSNVTVPRLIDALKLAQKYDAFLYLDIKEFNPEGLSLALKQSGADPSRMLPAITSMEAAREFRSYCPKSGWIWFGSDPEAPSTQSWFRERVALGCRAFELTENKVLYEREWTLQFIANAHSVGAKVWAYTINNESRIKEFADLGIDGIETDRPYVAQLEACGYNPISTYPEKITTGNWNFKARNLESAGVGSRLKYLAQIDSIIQPVVFGSTKQFGISSIGGLDTTVVKVPAFNPSNGLFAYDNFMMEDSGAIDYTYSVIMDIYVSSTNKGKFISLLQTNPDNLNDADFL